MSNILAWLGQHERTVIAVVIVGGSVLAIAILSGADVMPWFQWLGGLFK